MPLLVRLPLILIALLAIATAQSAATAPVVESIRVDGDTVAGRDGRFLIRGADAAAPMATVVLTFEGDSFGTSACRTASPGRSPGGPFAPGSPAVFAVPHRFGGPGRSEGAVRVDSGGCGEPSGSVLQPFTATVTAPGEPTQPIELGDPVQLLEDLPIDLPSVPGLDDLPALGPAGGLLTPLAAAACPGVRARTRDSFASRRRARAATLCLLNRERRLDGLRPLRQNRRLARAARAHARAMIRDGFFSHEGTVPPGRTLLNRLRHSDYLPAGRFLVGENLAYGRGGGTTPASVVLAWMDSSTHRANVLAPRFREIGIAVEPGSPVSPDRGVTYTTNFGRRQ